MFGSLLDMQTRTATGCQ